MQCLVDVNNVILSSVCKKINPKSGHVCQGHQRSQPFYSEHTPKRKISKNLDSIYYFSSWDSRLPRPGHQLDLNAFFDQFLSQKLSLLLRSTNDRIKL